MSDIIVDGKTRVAFVPSGTPSAFTVAQLNAGTLLHWMLVPTGLEGFEGSTAEIDNSALGSRSDSHLPGRTSFSGTNLLLKKQEGSDPVFDLLSVLGTDGFVVIRDTLDEAAAWAATQKYESYPVRTGEFNYVGRGEANSLLRYRVPTSITGARVRGVVAA
jgi:hypothetical protein